MREVKRRIDLSYFCKKKNEESRKISSLLRDYAVRNQIYRIYRDLCQPRKSSLSRTACAFITGGRKRDHDYAAKRKRGPKTRKRLKSAGRKTGRDGLESFSRRFARRGRSQIRVFTRKRVVGNGGKVSRGGARNDGVTNELGRRHVFLSLFPSLYLSPPLLLRQ